MRLRFEIGVRLGERSVTAGLWSLLLALERERSLAAAARSCGISYRHAWEMLRAAERDHGFALAILERGRGARLSEAAQLLLAAQRQAQRETAESLEAIAGSTAHVLDSAPSRAAARLSVCASHDLALIELKRHCARTRPAVPIELSFRGSIEALSALARGRCDLAGFHLHPSAADPYKRLFESRSMRAFVLARRRQGLIVAPSNPKGIRGIADLARKGIRFINRQPGSGTRLLLDRMLVEAHTVAAAIRGYEEEEFTHLAVAATIAAGHADAGIGIEAAAARYGLAFVPLAMETYYLAVARAHLAREPVRRLLQQLENAALRRRIGRLPGYDVAQTGSSADFGALFARPGDPPRRANARARSARGGRLR